MRELKLIIKSRNKRGFSADGSSLLPSALRPRLLSIAEKRHWCQWGRVLMPLVGVCAMILVGLVLDETNVSAASLDLTIPNDGFVVSNMTPISNSTTLYGESNKSNVTIKTDAAWGYSLNIKAKDGATNTLKTSDNKTLNSISSASSDYKTNTTTNLNSWAFLPGRLNSVENSTYQPGPKADLLLGKTSGSNSEPEAYPLSIAAKVDGSQASGTYKNTWTITATANTVTYSVTYNLNGGDSGSGPSNVNSTTTTEKTITLQNKTPTRSGYTFQGWCTSNPGTSETCSGSTYQPGNTYTLSSGTNTINLYAIWKAQSSGGGTNRGSLGNMQSFTSSLCSSKLPNIGDYGTATDSRDSNTYTIAKLADGKCWMVTNLKIVGRSISSSNSDMTSGSYTIPSSSTSGFSSSNYNGDWVYVDSTYGGYYSWHLATAGTGTQSMSSGNATSSICPKGWKLPTGGSGGDFQVMAQSYGSGTDAATAQALLATPVPGFRLGGSYYNSSPDNVGSRGRYWSSTATSSSRAYYLYFDTSSVDPTNSANTRCRGRSVRCVLR